MTNIANFNRLIDFIKTHPHQFDMNRWCEDRNDQPDYWNTVDCGTVMCIGGAAAYLMLSEGPLSVRVGAVQEMRKQPVAEWLGLSLESVRHLFYMETENLDHYGDYEMV